MNGKQKRWMRSAIETAKTMQMALPYQRGARRLLARKARIAKAA